MEPEWMVKGLYWSVSLGYPIRDLTEKEMESIEARRWHRMCHGRDLYEPR